MLTNGHGSRDLRVRAPGVVYRMMNRGGYCKTVSRHSRSPQKQGTAAIRHQARPAALLLLLGLSGFLTSALAFPTFDPFANATTSGGTAFASGAALYHQTNALGEAWAKWNGGSTASAVICTNTGLSYAGFPSAFPPPSPTNAAYLPGQTDSPGGVAGQSAALTFSRAVKAGPNGVTTNKVYASFLIKVSDLGSLASSSPIYFAGFATNMGDQSVTLPASAMKVFLRGESATTGQSTSWSIGVANNSGFTSAAFDGGGHKSTDVLFVVVAYEFGVNPGNPDVARMWVNPAAASFGAASPPVETASTNIIAAANKIAQAADFFLLDRTGGTLWGRLLVANLRVGTTWGYVTGGPEFTSLPLDVLSSPGAAAVFTVGAVSGSANNPLAYQWSFNGANLTNGAYVSGATSPALTISNLSAASAGLYTVAVSNALGAILAGARLSIANTDAPALLGAQSFGLSEVVVSLSQRLSPSSAQSTSNYFIFGAEGAVTILSALLDSSQSNVWLTVSPMVDGELYTLSVSNVANAFYPASTIAPDAHTNFVAHSYIATGIGNPPSGGGQVWLTNVVAVTGVGTDIGGTSDQFEFSYRVLLGNFHVSVCLQSLDPSDVWAKAGLMARASLEAGSPFAASLATPSLAGDLFEYRVSTNSTALIAGRFPANYPNTWLRLQRSGNVFSGYASYDGQSWVLLAQASIPMPSQVYLGMAVCSHSTSRAATAQFLLPIDTPAGASVSAVASPYEPLGPSSRKTGIVIPEIIYKPASRADGLNLEFIELYSIWPETPDFGSGARH